jgi:hypothetical protein
MYPPGQDSTTRCLDPTRSSNWVLDKKDGNEMS